MKFILLGIGFMICSFVFYYDTEGRIPNYLRVIVCQLGMIVSMCCLSFDLHILK